MENALELVRINNLRMDSVTEEATRLIEEVSKVMASQEKTIDAMRRQIIETEMNRSRDWKENRIQQGKMRHEIEQLKNQIEVYRKNCAREHNRCVINNENRNGHRTLSSPFNTRRRTKRQPKQLNQKENWHRKKERELERADGTVD
uniref:Uncharacterized protein n=1 Tax=Caenorhabditis japonica TaxID=281687 RepID=A0A8R1ILV2_CAEJA